MEEAVLSAKSAGRQQKYADRLEKPILPRSFLEKNSKQISARTPPCAKQEKLNLKAKIYVVDNIRYSIGVVASRRVHRARRWGLDSYPARDCSRGSDHQSGPRAALTLGGR